MSEPKDKATVPSVDSIVLLRIAEALERIANVLEAKPSQDDQEVKWTPFPWEQMSVRTRKYVARYVLQEIERGAALYAGMSWPLSCEDIRKLGEDELLEAKNFGRLGWSEVDAKLKEMGM